MIIKFYGAAHEVTGSCNYVECNGKKILIDCGMHQGTDGQDDSFPFSAKDIDCVILTHAHIDHSGLLPLLSKHGFNGKVYATKATYSLCEIMLKDSAHIQEQDADWHNRKAKRSGRAEVIPLYTIPDAEAVMTRFIPCDYNTKITVFNDITIRFSNAGHLLGAAFIELWIKENGLERKLVFSGDIGNHDLPLVVDPSIITEADYVVIESTYGDRNHEKAPTDYAERFADTIDKAFRRGGNVVIPSFAVGRTQEILYLIRDIKERGLVKSIPDFKVFMDSPLAHAATWVFNKNYHDSYDEKAMALVDKGVNPLYFDGLTLCSTTDESKAINDVTTPHVILSSSGMCEAGRIRHHLKHNLWSPDNTIMFVGYQASGTLGRKLLDGAESVTLFGEPIDVKAQIIQLEGISGHADQKGLISWLGNFSPAPKHIFVVHGGANVCEVFGELIRQKFGDIVSVPFFKGEYDLKDCKVLAEGEMRTKAPKQPSESAAKQSSLFYEMRDAYAQLGKVIDTSKGIPNRELVEYKQLIEEIMSKLKR